MSAAGIAIADQLQSRLGDLDATILPLEDKAWRSHCTSEGWPLGLVAFHIALGIERQAGWVSDALTGRAPFEFSWAQTDALNAAVAAAGILPSKSFVRGALSGAASRIDGLLRAMSDEDLDRDAMSYEDRMLSIRLVMRSFMRHIDDHFASIRRTLSTS